MKKHKIIASFLFLIILLNFIACSYNRSIFHAKELIEEQVHFCNHCQKEAVIESAEIETPKLQYLIVECENKNICERKIVIPEDFFCSISKYKNWVQGARLTGIE